MLRKLAMIGAGVIVSAGATFAAPVAQAADSSQVTWVAQSRGTSDCPQYYFCFWEDDNFGGRMGKVKGSNDHWSEFKTPGDCFPTQTWNDCASAYWNRTGYYMWVYEDSDRHGRGAKLDGIARTVARDWEDKISSNWLSSQRY